MALRYLMHADDIGLSSGITRSIGAAIDEGLVRSVSLIVNGSALEEAKESLLARPDVRVSVHLNLLEGQPLSGADRVPLLVGEDGQLAATFQKLTRLWLAGGRAGRVALKKQIGLEFSAQINRAIDALGGRLDRLLVDSHTHIHALPFVLDVLLGQDYQRPIDYVRLPREPWHVSLNPDDRSTVFGANLIKHMLLNRLSVSMEAKLKARGIAYNPLMLGVLHTGAMSPSAIKAGIASCENVAVARRGRTFMEADPVEVLLHPGRAEESEHEFWRGRPDLWAYYRSQAREKEFETSQDAELEDFFGAA